MKLSISNIAWDTSLNKTVYSLMKNYGFMGLEIAPTKIFLNDPYTHIAEAVEWKNQLNSCYNFEISSMQSICYGKTENIFAGNEDRESLLGHMKKVILFAEAVHCGNIVFGCPKNRNNPNNEDEFLVYPFFSKMAEYAQWHGTTLGMEANPVIYNTNYINTTESAIQLIEEIDNPSFKLNLDIGTVIQNNENLKCIEGKISFINHVHISEPYLKKIQPREIHNELSKILKNEHYNGFISIEMGTQESIDDIEEVMRYVNQIFC